MDKYEYNLKLDQIKSLCAEENYEGAAELADTINWSKIRNVNALVRAGEVYGKVGRYEESREILLMAYDRSPIGRMIIYRLAEVAVKMKDFEAAGEYYNEFVEIAPHDNLKFVLRYEIKKAQNAGYEELIHILEALKEQEYTEEWSYELAYLYHKAGMSEKCIEACDELILWFGEGPYVERALELKMLYQPLTKAQEEKYRKFHMNRNGVTQIGAEEMRRSGEYIHDTVEIPQVTLNTERYNTVNLQAEIAKGMQQIIAATEKETVSDTMDNIKKIVEDIPYLQLAKELEELSPPEEPAAHIETDEEIDGSLKLNFQELLGEDSDGQLSLVMSEKAKLEQQITGQMTIADVLDEWEKTKRAAEAALKEAEQRKLESAKARALQEAESLMDRLNDVMPKLESGVSPRELLEEEYLHKIPTAEMKQGPRGSVSMVGPTPDMVATAQFEEPGTGAEAAPDMQDIPTASVSGMQDISTEAVPGIQDVLTGAVSEAQDISTASVPEMQDISTEAVPGIQDVLTGAVSEVQDIPTEAVPGIQAVLAGVMSERPDIPTEAVPGIQDVLTEPALETQDTAAGIASDVPEAPDKIEETVSYSFKEEPSIGLQDQEEPTELREPEISDLSESSEAETDVPQAAEAEPSAPFREPVRMPAAELGANGKSEWPEAAPAVGKQSSMAEELEDLLNQTTTRFAKLGHTHTRLGEEVAKALDREGSVMIHQLDREEPKVEYHLTEEQKAIFSYFVPVKGMENQLGETVSVVSDHLNKKESAGRGNLIIQGGQGCGKTVLATSIIKVLQEETGGLRGKIGKIDASTLNTKDINGLLRKVAGGCLIIEGAGELSREAAVTLSLLMEQDKSGLLVILEDTSKGIKKVLAQDAGFAKKFTQTVSVPIFNSDELVSFAKSYSNELGYEIDNMAILALYNRISNIQTLDQATTLTEVKEIVDEAIEREGRASLKKAFSIVTASRYTEDDKILLREKNFE